MRWTQPWRPHAVDAAVAAAGVLGVTEPYSCGIGGGGFTVIRTAGGKVTTIDGREESPASIEPESFWENGKPLPSTTAENEFVDSPEGGALAADPYRHAFARTSDIGAVTGIEFLSDGRTLAAAEPVRRGGGTAAVVSP